MALCLAQERSADELLERDPLALVVGMLLDQQFPMERAFAAPLELTRRLGRDLDAAKIVAHDPGQFAELFARPPALHRFPVAMANRVQDLARHLIAHHGGDAAAIWRNATTGAELARRLRELPGFGPRKAQIFLALLGKQLGVRPRGWREAAGGYGETGVYRSVADVTDALSLAQVRAYKKESKGAAAVGRRNHQPTTRRDRG